MPRFKRKRKTRQSVIRGKRSKRRRRSFARLPTTLVPATKTVRLIYCQNLELNPPTGSPARYDFRANSIYDPDYTGIGHQPLGRDQWSAYYDHYTVIGAKITCKFTSISNGVNNQFYVGVALKDTIGQWDASLETACERNQYGLKYLANSTSKSMATTGATYSPRKFFGIKDIGDNRGLLGAAVGTNPNEDAIFNVVAYGASPDTSFVDPAPVNVMVRISYLVKFSERKKIPGS